MSSTKQRMYNNLRNQQSNTTIDLLVNNHLPSIATDGLVLRGKMKIDPPTFRVSIPISCVLHQY